MPRCAINLAAMFRLMALLQKEAVRWKCMIELARAESCAMIYTAIWQAFLPKSFDFVVAVLGEAMSTAYILVSSPNYSRA